MMICEECKGLGINSEIVERGRSETMLACSPFCDKENKIHLHDPNIIKTAYSCSRGHSWVVESKRKCWCGWPEKNNRRYEANI